MQDSPEKEARMWDQGPGVGGTLLYKPYRYVPPHQLGFLLCFGQKTGRHFAHFGLELGLVFKETTECMNIFIVSIRQMSKVL